MSYLRILISTIREKIERDAYHMSLDRKELAADRLEAHQLYLEGKCKYDPYRHPSADWYKCLEEQ